MPTVLATPHPQALGQAYAEHESQHRRSDYVRFFRQPGGVAEAALLAEGAARLREAYQGMVPASTVQANVTRLVEPGALTAALNWYRAVGHGLDIPVGPVPVDTLYAWGDQDAFLGPEAAALTAGHVTGRYRFEPIAGASHWLPEERPDTVAALVVRHLRG